jgi:Leucine-rich repeat (LRR) protein
MDTDIPKPTRKPRPNMRRRNARDVRFLPDNELWCSNDIANWDGVSYPVSRHLCITDTINPIPWDKILLLKDTKSIFIEIRKNTETIIPPEIGTLKHLEELEMNVCGIKTLPEELWTLTNLKTITLLGNEIEVLSENVGRLTNLETLNICANRIAILPKTIGNLRNLTHFDFTENPIEALPDSFVNLHKLTTLIFDCTRTKNISPEIWNMPNLCEIKYCHLLIDQFVEPIRMYPKLIFTSLQTETWEDYTYTLVPRKH